MVHVWIPRHGCASPDHIATIVNWVANIGVSMMAVLLVCAVPHTTNDKIRNYKMPFAMPSTVIKSVFWTFCHRKWKSRGYRSVWKSHCCIWVCYWALCFVDFFVFLVTINFFVWWIHLACEKGAWKCVQHLVIARNDEINLIKDEYYPIHQAVLHDQRFLELLIQHGAITTVRTCTQQMTLLHVGECSTLLAVEPVNSTLKRFIFLFRSVIFVARKSADDTLATIRILLERGCKELINEPDSLGNTPLHALLVRYALEEARYGFQKWNKWDILHLVRFLLQNGAKASINQAGNSALACVFRHVRDWEVCYELLNMLIKEEGTCTNTIPWKKRTN